ncbi:MAG: hypothetical protein D6704_06395 [Nitrospirae bacterium]|nr:MAG: hypothetical protein D6704_06395 [Nitrospirota bacterium]
MNYPLWDVPVIGGGILIAIISIIHVFISHFAVGAGVFNVLTERMARRARDAALLAFVRRHSFVLLLVSMVVGALTGVGIWFAIGLVHPTGTSALIHVFVWAWAIEWIIFVVEVVTAFVYVYGWDRLPPQIHQRIGWMYAVSSWLSLFVINGILTFMLTPGEWLATRDVWDAFFNPTFWPSLVLRTLVALALAGLVTLLLSTLQTDDVLRERFVTYTAQWVLYPLIGMIPAGFWYIAQLPQDVARWFEGSSAPLTMFFMLSALFTGLILAVLLFAALRQPRHFTWPVALLIMFFGLLATASTEMVREAIRRPFLIRDYLYSNAVRVDEVESINRTGILAHARWVPVRQVTPETVRQAGQAVFDVQCRICHTIHGFNGIAALTATWREETMYAFLGHMHEVKPFMPPFLGTDAERRALAAWIVSLQQ